MAKGSGERPLVVGDRIYLFVDGGEVSLPEAGQLPEGDVYGTGPARIFVESPIVFPPDDFDSAQRFKVGYRGGMEREILEAVLRASDYPERISYEVRSGQLGRPAKALVLRVASLEPMLSLERVKSVNCGRVERLWKPSASEGLTRILEIRENYDELLGHPDVLVALAY